jgi:hypothetical protein
MGSKNGIHGWHLMLGKNVIKQLPLLKPYIPQEWDFGSH